MAEQPKTQLQSVVFEIQEQGRIDKFQKSQEKKTQNPNKKEKGKQEHFKKEKKTQNNPNDDE